MEALGNENGAKIIRESLSSKKVKISRLVQMSICDTVQWYIAKALNDSHLQFSSNPLSLFLVLSFWHATTLEVAVQDGE
jgi:hypothetical protein